MAQARTAFDIPLTTDQRQALANWLQTELYNALAARSALEPEVDYWHQLYEQARTRSQDNLPWPDAADLTSYIPCEKVDSIHARIMRTVWVNPLWTVEGWGETADRAPFVEEFHQFKAEEERLQSVLDKWALMALIEPRGLLEVYESSERRPTRKQIQAKPKTTPDGGILFDEKGMPQLEQDANGAYTEAKGNEVAVTTVIDSSDVVRSGPQYRVIPYRDSLILPGHARDKDEVWGYAKRIFPQLRDLKARAADGVYDVDAVGRLTEVGDKEPDAALQRSGMGVAPQQRETAEKELWEGLILCDVNSILDSRGQDPIRGVKAGARWYLVTIHQRSGVLLRWNHDDFERSRYVPLMLFPRPDRATEGYSFIGHKLVTTIEEHTAYRNMGADATSKAVNKPILKLQGALWDEDEQPWGPKAVITVRSPQEISEVQVSDAPASVYANIDRCERTADRLSGVNDIASGQVVAGDKTLGEIQMATEQAFVRMDLVVRRFQEAMEDLWQIRHAIWKRTLAEQPEGIDAPESVLIGLEGRGVPIDQYMPNGKITAAMLDGPFRGKPYGSVQNADLNRQRNDFVGMMQALPMLLQAFPELRPRFASPRAAYAMGRQFLRVFNVQNLQAFLGSPSQDLQSQQQVSALPLPSYIPPPPPPTPPPGLMPPGIPGQGGPPPQPHPMGGPPPMPPGLPPPAGMLH
jgi:hypothetical protein